MSNVACESSDKIALLTLNRPEKLNALSYGLIDELMALLDTIEADPGIHAVILTGAGERAFSAGADITEFSRSVHDSSLRIPEDNINEQIKGLLQRAKLKLHQGREVLQDSDAIAQRQGFLLIVSYEDRCNAHFALNSLQLDLHVDAQCLV